MLIGTFILTDSATKTEYRVTIEPAGPGDWLAREEEILEARIAGQDPSPEDPFVLGSVATEEAEELAYAAWALSVGLDWDVWESRLEDLQDLQEATEAAIIQTSQAMAAAINTTGAQGRACISAIQAMAETQETGQGTGAQGTGLERSPRLGSWEPSGPLRVDGRPDMRYSANIRPAQIVLDIVGQHCGQEKK